MNVSALEMALVPPARVVTVMLTLFVVPFSFGTSARISELPRLRNCAGLPAPKSTAVTELKFWPRMITMP